MWLCTADANLLDAARQRGDALLSAFQLGCGVNAGECTVSLWRAQTCLMQ